MRHLCTLLLSLVFISVSAQDKIYQKDGKVITPEPGTLRFEISERTFYYGIPDAKKKQKKITYKEIDHVLFNGYKLKPVKLKKGRFGGYFVLAENSRYNLYTMAIKEPYHYYEVIVTDKENKIIEYNDFMDNNMARHNKDREAAGSSIEKYFADCPGLMTRIKEMKQQNTEAKQVKMSWWVRDLLVQPTFFDCTN